MEGPAVAKISIKNKPGGASVPQMVKRRFPLRSWSPGWRVWAVEPASDSVSPSLTVPPPLALSLKNKYF